MNDEHKLYSAPSLPALAAYSCVAVMLFFAGMNFTMREEVKSLQEKVNSLDKSMSQLSHNLAALQHLQREVAALRRYGRESRRPAAVERTPAPRPAPARVSPFTKRNPDQKALRITAPDSFANGDTLTAGEIASLRQPDNPEKIRRPINPSRTTPPPLTPRRQPEKKTVKRIKPLTGPPLEEPERTVHSGKDSSPVPVRNPEILKQPKQNPQPAMSKTPDSSRRGAILAINPDVQRVFLSLGTVDGVEPSNRFSVWRIKRYIGEVRVVKVFWSMSACDIVGPTPRGIRLGDVARPVKANPTAGAHRP